MFVCENCLPRHVETMTEPAAIEPMLDESKMCICEKAWAAFSVVLVSDIFNAATRDEWGVKCHYLSTFNMTFKNLS